MESSLQQANHLSIRTKSLIKQKITSNTHFNNGPPDGFGSGLHGLGKWVRYRILGYTSSGSKKSVPPLNGLVSTTNGLAQPVYKTHIHDPPYRTHNMQLWAWAHFLMPDGVLPNMPRGPPASHSFHCPFTVGKL